MCGNDLQGPKGGPAVVLLPHIVVIAVPVLQLAAAALRRGGDSTEGTGRTVAAPLQQEARDRGTTKGTAVP